MCEFCWLRRPNQSINHPNQPTDRPSIHLPPDPPQDNREQRKGGEQKKYSFMLRLKSPAGEITPELYKVRMYVFEGGEWVGGWVAGVCTRGGGMCVWLAVGWRDHPRALQGRSVRMYLRGGMGIWVCGRSVRMHEFEKPNPKTNQNPKPTPINPPPPPPNSWWTT